MRGTSIVLTAALCAAHGLAAATARAEALGREALDALAAFGGEADTLRELVRMVQDRRS